MSGHDATTAVVQAVLAGSYKADGLTVREVAQRMGLPRETVRRRLALHAQLSQIGHTPDGAGHRVAGGAGSAVLSAPGHQPIHTEQEA